MLRQLSIRIAPVTSRAADVAPVAPACCNACRTCATANLAAAALALGSTALAGAGRLLRRRAQN